MKKFWILSAMLCSLTLGCGGTQTTTPATETTGAAPATTDAVDEHAGHDHAEGEEHTEGEAAAPAAGE